MKGFLGWGRCGGVRPCFLIQNKAEQIQYFYNASGLVTEVWYEGSPKVKFMYNDRNHRVKKESYHNENLLNSTYYVRDVAGQVMAIYNSNVSSSGSQGEPYRELVEQPIYGAGRIGVQYTNGLAVYELTDHLGNVRALFTKESATDSELEGYTDYYPGGMIMPGRNMVGSEQYRNDYQGQFSEKDNETGHNFFERRLYDSRIMRWLRPDDVRRTSQSPYMAMANNPIVHGDPDGRDVIILNSTMAVYGFGHAAVLIGNDRDGWRYFSKNGTEAHGLFGESFNPNDGTPFTNSDFRGTGLKASQVIQIVNAQYREQHPDGERYDRFVRINTTPEQDEPAAEAAITQVYSYYSVDKTIFNNDDPCAGSCLDVAGDAVRTLNLPNYRERAINSPGPNLWFHLFTGRHNFEHQGIPHVEVGQGHFGPVEE